MLVIVTGASKGIGFELVKKFKNEEYLVMAVSRHLKDLQRYIKDHKIVNIIPVQADISTTTGVRRVATEVAKLKQQVGIVINNAGCLVKKDFAKITEKDLKTTFATNVFGPFLLIQELLPFLGKKRKSHIVNISSMGGFQGSAKFQGLTAYSSSKAALSGLTECLAEEFKDTPISVNCLAIGAVNTEMLATAFPGYVAPVSAEQMAEYIFDFSVNGHKYYNGKVLPVSLTTP